MRAVVPVAVLLAIVFGLSGTGTSAATVGLPQLAAEFGISPSDAAWMVSAFAVAFAVATPLQGRLGDLLGIRIPLVVGISAMALGAVISACAPSFAVLLPARVLQGVGSAAVPVLVTAFVTIRYQGAQRSTALGLIAGFSSIIYSLGPLAGGLLVSIAGWRAPLALPALVVLAAIPLWRMTPARGTGERIDLVGATLVAGTASGMVLLLQSPSTGLVAAAVGAALLVTAGIPLVAWVRAHPEGFLPRAIITNGTVLRSAFAAAAVPATVFALLLGIPLVVASWGWSPLAAGLVLVPSALTGFISPWLARFMLDRFGPTRSLVVTCPGALGALVLAALGSALRTPVPLVLAGVLLTLTFGVAQPALMAAVSFAVDPQRRGVAVGIAMLMFFVGASVGAATVGGLADLIDLSAIFVVLAVLPVAGLVTLLLGGRTARPGEGAVPHPVERAA